MITQLPERTTLSPEINSGNHLSGGASSIGQHSDEHADHIPRLVHDLMVTISDLLVASRDVKTAPQVFAEQADIRLAHSVLGNLIDRLPVKTLVAAE